MRLVLLGLPGCGKGTQARLLVERLGVTYIGTGDILRDAINRGTEMGREVKPLMEQGLLVPDHIVNDVVAELFRGANRPEKFVTDGYPRTYAQAISLDALLRLERLELTRVILLTISDDEVARRMLSRGREDDNEDTIRRRLREFHKNNDALVDYYTHRGVLSAIPAVGAVEDIYANIVRALGAAKEEEAPVFAAVLVLMTAADPSKPEFTYSDFSRPADKVAASVEKNRVVFTVASTRGIGAATINLKEGAWPKEVVILLTYEKGAPFKSLENFQVTTDRIVATGSIKSSGKVPFAFLGAKGEGEQMVPDQSGGTLDIKVVQTDKGIELRLPPDMLNGSKLVALSWIDAYRR